MTVPTVTWRQAGAATTALVVALLAIVVATRSEGIEAVDAVAGRATSWFVHQPTGRAVLVDGYRGQAVASVDTGAAGADLSVAEGGLGAYLLNGTTAEAQALDPAELRLGTPFGLSALGTGRALSGVGQAGLVVVNPDENEANIVPVDAEPLAFPVETGSAVQIAPDGSIWSIVDGDLRRTTSSSLQTVALDADAGAGLTMVGNLPFVVDTANRRARLGDGEWQALPTTVDPSEIVPQVAGPPAPCGWVGADDTVWCVSEAGIEETSTVDGLDIDGSSLLAVAGDAAAVITRSPSSIVRFDWSAGEVLDDVAVTVSADAELAVTATVDLIWVDDVAGEFVWGVNPWDVRAIDKNAQGILVLGEDGTATQQDDGSTDGSADDSAVDEPELREPDGNGIDDPPIALDDPVTARSGASVPVDVTANDYDPDGEAVVVATVGVPGHGSVDIGTAGTVVYTPEPGYVGLDRFPYTIVDGNGSEATADVIVEMLAPGATNKPPVGVADTVPTGAGVPVVVDVLLNDVDPERDALRLGGFSPPAGVGAQAIGEVTETRGPSGLPALRFAPAEGFEGTAIFTYRPVDGLDAIGADVEVRVEVARTGDPNRPPVLRPDAIRLRRNVETPIPVLVNDADPDGDVLSLSVVEPVPDGLEVLVEGSQLSVVARAGAAPLLPFEYEVDDGNGHVVRASVLVAVIDDLDANRPPVVAPDSDKAVVGRSVLIDVIANDVDPDGDPLTVVAVTQPAGNSGQAVVFSRGEIQFSPAPLADEDSQVSARFSYVVSDGHGHEVSGEVIVTVLPEPLAEPPFARDDSTFTFVDVPVTVDVLRNDGDPSGGRPSILGRPGCPGGGLATVTADSQVRFDPPTGASGAFRCTYEVTNAQGLRAAASIIVSVRPLQQTNLAPEAVNDRLTVAVGEVGSIDVLANDRDPDGSNARLQLVSSTAPTLGTATRVGNVITFVAGTQTGNTTINYQVVDEGGAVSLGRLLVTITERENRPPIAVNDSLTIFGPASPQQINALSNDSDPDDTPGGLSVVSASRVSGDASVSLSGSVVTVSPPASFVGVVVGSYTMRDGGGLTATATISLTVAPPLNRPPDARDDVADVVNGGSVNVPVLFNDTDPDGNRLSLAITGRPDPVLGNASVAPGGTISFTAVPGATGTALVTYEVTDGELTDTAALRITVRPCAESTPVAGDSFLTTGFQQPVAVDLAALSSGGTVVDVVGPPGFANGIYTPPAGENGNVTITYGVVNGCRLRANGRVVIDVNQDPVGRPRTVEVGRGDTVTVPVSDLATDAEPLTISQSTGEPSWVSVQGDRLVISPPLGTARASYPWSVVVMDPGGLSTTVRVEVVVPNRLPVANADTADLGNRPAATFPIVDNDSDPDSNDPLVIATISATSITFTNGETGTVEVEPDRRSVRITAGAGRGTATFTYTVVDGDGGASAPATVTVVGPPINVAPVANDQTVAVTVGEERVLELDVSDPDGGPLSVVELSDPSGVVAGTMGVRLRLFADEAGVFTVTYRVTDGELRSNVATVTVEAT